MDPRSEFGPHTMENLPTSSSSCFFSSVTLPADILWYLSHELEKHTVEMDCFLQIENQRLRSWISIEETRQRQIIMQRYESKMEMLMFQIEERLLSARNRAKQLQDSLRVAENEAHLWQSKVMEKEAMVFYLRNKLNSATETASVCDSSSSSLEETEMRNMYCKLCRKRRLCSVFLPCRHLCCCDHCERFLEECPVCGTTKKESVEVYPWGESEQ